MFEPGLREPSRYDIVFTGFRGSADFNSRHPDYLKTINMSLYLSTDSICTIFRPFVTIHWPELIRVENPVELTTALQV